MLIIKKRVWDVLRYGAWWDDKWEYMPRGDTERSVKKQIRNPLVLYVDHQIASHVWWQVWHLVQRHIVRYTRVWINSKLDTVRDQS